MTHVLNQFHHHRTKFVNCESSVNKTVMSTRRIVCAIHMGIFVHAKIVSKFVDIDIPFVHGFPREPTYTTASTSLKYANNTKQNKSKINQKTLTKFKTVYANTVP